MGFETMDEPFVKLCVMYGKWSLRLKTPSSEHFLVT